jgi:hypothetical protein
MRLNKKLQKFIIRYGINILLAGLLAAVIINNQIQNNITAENNRKAQEEQITAMEEALHEHLSRQTMLFFETSLAAVETVLDAFDHEITGMKADLEQRIAAGTAITGSRITGTNNQIQRVDALYSELLAEQQKRTVDSIYTEASLIETEDEAARLFNEGNYAHAGSLYAMLAQSRPENFEARFYYLYSLFLTNKMDRGNYYQIKEGFTALERNGYQRPEMREALEYINVEETGLEAGSGR